MSAPTNKTTTDAIARLEKRVEALEEALREIAEMRLDETVDAPIAQARARREMHEIARRALEEGK